MGCVYPKGGYILYPVRIIKDAFLRAAVVRHPKAAEAIEHWIHVVRLAKWKNPVAMHQTFSDVDPVKVKGGHTVYVFNICRNAFRLIAAVHFNRDRVFTLRFLTHREYDLNHWKEEL